MKRCFVVSEPFPGLGVRASDDGFGVQFVFVRHHAYENERRVINACYCSYVCMYVCMYLWTYVSMCMCICVSTYLYVHVYVYVYVCMHICMYNC